MQIPGLVCGFAVCGCLLFGQAPSPNADARILGVIPNYQAIEDPHATVKPLTTLEKWTLFAREATDPYNLAGAAIGAGLSHAGDADPHYGQGGGAFADRFGAAACDMTTQTFFSTAVFAPLLHQDPRYFRRGPEFSIPRRLLYSVSRTVVTRTDSGKPAFNWSNVLGMALGIALSNAYYPDGSVGSRESIDRFRTSLTGEVLGNLLPEFWPDVKAKLFHRKHRDR